MRDLCSKKQRKPNLIQPEDKNTIKDKFLDSIARSKEGKWHPQTRTPALIESDRRNSKPCITHIDFALLRFEGSD